MLYPDFRDLVSLKDRKRIFKHPSSKSVKSTISGNHLSSFRGQGIELDTVRQYVAGDDIRNIDWKVTARTGLAHVKVFKEERERQIVLCVDLNAAMRFGTRNTFKSIQAARIAALLGWSGVAEKDRISACFFGDVEGGIQFFAPKRSEKSFCSLLKILTEEPKERHQVFLEEALQHISRKVHAGSLIYLISDFMDISDHLKSDTSLSFLSKKCDLVFIGVNDPSDQEILPVGTLGLQSNSFEKIYINTESLSGRKAYEERWKERENKLKEITSKLKIPFLGLTTESDVYVDLTFGLKKHSEKVMKEFNPLEILNDIEGLDAISRWPLSPTCYLLIGLAFLALVAFSFWLIRWIAFKRSWKHDALKRLSSLEKGLSEDTSRETLILLSEYLRRIALKRFPRKECASLVGNSWLTWLKAHDPKEFDWETKGVLLIEVPYSPSQSALPTSEIKELIQAMKDWVH